MALEAVADRGLVDGALDFGGVLVGVTAEAKIKGRRGGQLNARDVLVGPNLMASGATKLDRGVYSLPLRFVLVAFDALGRGSVLVQWNGVDIGEYAAAAEKRERRSGQRAKMLTPSAGGPVEREFRHKDPRKLKPKSSDGPRMDELAKRCRTARHLFL